MTTKELTARLTEQKKLKAELLPVSLLGEVSQLNYAQVNADFDAGEQGKYDLGSETIFFALEAQTELAGA